MVECRLSDDKDVSLGDFVPCNSSFNFSGIFDTTLYLNLYISRPVKIINDHNPYRVEVSIDGCDETDCKATATFDYRVGVVNPI